MGPNYDLLLFQFATSFLEFRVILLEWAGAITCADLRSVARFATDIDMEADPKYLNGIEL
jgi:hypothetical protein